jgi:hypothetical protein
MIDNIKIHYRRDFAGMLRQLPKALEKANKDVGVEWFTKMLPGHFEPSAVSKYKYQPRTKGYQIRKAKKQGHQKPLVWSGAMSQALMSAGNIKGTPRQATVRMSGPRWLKGWIAMSGSTRGGAPANYPNKEQEIKRITDDERDHLAEVLKKRMAVEINNLRAPRDVTL